MSSISSTIPAIAALLTGIGCADDPRSPNNQAGVALVELKPTHSAVRIAATDNTALYDHTGSSVVVTGRLLNVSTHSAGMIF